MRSTRREANELGTSAEQRDYWNGALGRRQRRPYLHSLRLPMAKAVALFEVKLALGGMAARVRSR